MGQPDNYFFSSRVTQSGGVCGKLNSMANKEVVAAIDKEIARLQQARDILAGGDDEEEGTRRGATKPTAAKKRVGRPAGTKRVLSPEARKRIAEAQKKRWAAQKASK